MPLTWNKAERRQLRVQFYVCHIVERTAVYHNNEVAGSKRTTLYEVPQRSQYCKWLPFLNSKTPAREAACVAAGISSYAKAQLLYRVTVLAHETSFELQSLNWTTASTSRPPHILFKCFYYRQKERFLFTASFAIEFLDTKSQVASKYLERRTLTPSAKLIFLPDALKLLLWVALSQRYLLQF